MIELKGSYSFGGVKDEKKAVYTVKFNSEKEALEHILKTFDEKVIVEHFWYGFHINDVNKGAKAEETESGAYSLAEVTLTDKFPSAVFVRGIEKNKTISAEDKAILAMFKGMSKVQIAEKLGVSLEELDKMTK